MTAGDIAAVPARRRRARRFVGLGLGWSLLAVGFLLAFFLLPLIDNGIKSFFGPDGFSTAPYRKLLSDPYYLAVTWRTLQVSAIVTVASLLEGYPVAYFFVRYAGRWQTLMIMLLIAPLLTSIIMRTFGWQVLFARRGVVNVVLRDLGIIERPLNLVNDPAMVYVGLVHVLVPFMVLSIAAVLQRIDPRLEESAMILGAGRLRAFLSVTLPLSLDGVATGCILVFMLTNGSFITMLLLGGGNVVTLPLLIYQQFNLTRDTAFAGAMGNVLLVFAVACLFVQLRLIARRGVKA